LDSNGLPGGWNKHWTVGIFEANGEVCWIVSR
jgi:hypothetical protein